MFAQLFNAVIGNSEACCLCVATVAFQDVGTVLQGGNNVESFLATCRATAELWPSAEYQDGALELFGEPTGHQADNAFGPVLAADQYYLIVGTQPCLAAHAVHQFFRLQLPRQVELFQFSGIVRSFFRAIGGQQLEGKAGILHAPGSVNAWSQGIGDIALADPARLQIGLLHQGQQARLLGSIQFLHPQAHKRMVFAQQWRDIGNATHGYQVEEGLFFFHRAIIGTVEGLCQFKSDACATEITFAVRTVWSPRVYHGVGVWALLRRMVMVCDNNINAQARSICYLFNVRACAVCGDNK